MRTHEAINVLSDLRNGRSGDEATALDVAIIALNKANVIMCAWCLHETIRSEAHEATAQALTDHVMVCEKNPLVTSLIIQCEMEKLLQRVTDYAGHTTPFTQSELWDELRAFMRDLNGSRREVGERRIQRDGLEAAFAASPDELGRTAVEAARNKCEGEV